MTGTAQLEFVPFSNTIEAQVPAVKIIRVILDNYAAHEHPVVPAWLAGHPRFIFQRGVFRSVTDLQATINRFIAEHDRDSKPFVRARTRTR
jgi:hypothetical protein